jgi:signal transduction histidine kinase
MANGSGASGLARIWLNLPLSRKGIAIVAIPVLSIFAMLAMFARLQRRAEEADGWVIHTAQVLTESKEILSKSLSLEATARGYLLTRDPAFVQLHEESRRLLFDAFGRIDRLTADNPGQQERMRRCERLMRDEIAALDAQVALGPSAALTGAVNGSRHRVDALRGDIDDFDREEHRLLGLRQITRLSHRAHIRLSLIGFALLGIISGIVGARLFTSGVKRRLDRIGDNAARIARRESKVAVDGGADAIGQLESALLRTTRDLLEREERLAMVAAELERAKDAAEAAARAKSEFVATISHEIRSPMNALLGATEMLASTGLSPAQSEYVALLNRAGTNLLGTVNEVLDHAKIEAGQFELECVTFDCAAVVDRVAGLLAVSASSKSLDLLVKYTPETPRHVSGDPARLERVLMNLVSNAIKFTDSGVVAIRVEPAGEPDLVHFTVADSGIGIARDRQQAIFEKYVQAGASTSRTHGGTGLGLAIAKHIVEKMGGRIWVESAAGEGSTFHFTALLPASAAPAAVAPAPERKSGGAAKVLGARILLAEDAVSNVALVKAYLVGAVCELDVAADGVAALDRLKSGRYDVALMDVQMPGLDG